MKSNYTTTLLLIMLMTLYQSSPAQSCVKVEVSGFRAFTGKLYISIYKNQDSFLKIGKEIMTRVVSVKDSVQSEVAYLCDLPAGWYAVALYHDEDDNNRMNTGFLGIPREPYGLSNNVRPRFSYPRFNQCEFYVPDHQEKQVAIALITP
jgi:uncharacterized protein (DUF2141 family)